MNSTMAHALKPQTPKPGLNVYQVGDHDYYAASSAAEAEQLHLNVNELDEVDRESAQLVPDEVLDKPWQDEDQPGIDAGTLRQWLSEATAPCWLSGTE